MCPDVRIQSGQNFPKFAQKEVTAIFTEKVMFFQNSLKATKYVNFVRFFFYQNELSKIGKSGRACTNVGEFLVNTTLE